MTGGVAAILGDTGRNFGAGMSGGVAYVLDEHDRFQANLNTEMVSLEQMTEDDGALLRSLVENHVELTGSTVAERLLKSWDTTVGSFCKVMPDDYRRVLDAQAKAEQFGIDPVNAIMEAARG